MKSLLIPWAALLCGPLLSPSAWADGADNFDGNSKNPLNWGTDDVSGNGSMNDAGPQLGYSCSSGTLQDQVDRPWVRTGFPYNANWEMQIETFNGSFTSGLLQVNSMGITILSPLSGSNFVYHEIYNSFGNVGANARMYVNDVSVGGNDSSSLGINFAALRLRWDSVTKVLTCDYDTNPTDGFQWIELASFGLAGSGGASADADWGMADSDQFFMSIYGYSAFMPVPAGQMTFDNFSETGGVTPSGGPRPEPTGSFPFVFPTGNDLITRIISLTGNYQGISPTTAQRAYSIDVAQDESGKIAAMGTIEGIEDKTGSSQLTANVGSVKTVDAEPVATLKVGFQGALDDTDVTYKASATIPAELVDLGGGEMGVMGSGSYKAKLGGVPFAGSNVPVDLVAPPGSEDNLKEEWSLQLDLAAKIVKGKERIVASAILVRPDGDVIEFPEKAVKYSQATGYKLSFKKGTNTTANPDVIDAKTTILLTGLKFVKVGDAWEPEAGTITYQFLGQKGVENLMEFVAP
jgi:hypothetical protein